MAVFEIEDYIKTTDPKKAEAQLEHEFVPMEDYPEIVLKCKYLQSGEKMKYVHFGEDRQMSFDYRRMFADKVIGITGVAIKNKTGKEEPITDAKTFLALPTNSIFEFMIVAFGNHLVNSDSLSKIEVKN